MKAIMISIKPKWCAKIMNGEKTIEIRKTMPKCDLPIDVYIYCTWGTGKYHQMMKQFGEYHFNKNIGGYCGFNGKVVAKFTLNKVEEILPFEEYESPFGMAYKLTKDKIVFCQKAQLTYDEYNHYLKGKKGYAIHISDLEIFDRPKDLIEFSVRCPKADIKFNGVKGKMLAMKQLTKAPQSWCYVEVEQ